MISRLQKCNEKRIAVSLPFDDHAAAPVNNELEIVAPCAFDAPALETCGVLNRDGIFYARLKMQGQDAPLMIALHGVRSELEAHQAFSTLLNLPAAECCA